MHVTHMYMYAHRHPNGLVGDLIKALEEIERNDVAKSLRVAVMESKPYKDMAKKGWWHCKIYYL